MMNANDLRFIVGAQHARAMGGRPPMIGDDEILEIFREADDPVLGVSEVADELGYSLQGTGKRLDALADEGRLMKKVTGGARIYWLPERAD